MIRFLGVSVFGGLAMLLSASALAEPTVTAPATDAPPASEPPPAPDAPPAEPAVDPLLQPLAEVADLARAGASQLALSRVDGLQPPFDADPPAWMAWERERIYLLQSGGETAAVIERLEALPGQVSPSFRIWAEVQLAEALLKEEDGPRARTLLRTLLWERGESLDDQARAHLRRMVIQTYLQDDLLEDARTALLRYRQDYGEVGLEWRLLQALVLLRSERPAEVVELLSGEKTAEPLAYRLLGELRSGSRAPQKVYEQSIKIAGGKSVSPADQALLWAVTAEAARAMKVDQHIKALERLWSLPLEPDLAGRLFDASPDDLWAAYLEEGQVIGNREQRLLGNDEDWYFPATESMEKDPWRARILFTVLAFYGSDEGRRDLAHEYLVPLLEDLPDGKALVRNLYLKSDRFADISRLPLVIRYRLIDEALESGDLTTASRLMSGLSKPPGDTDAFEWDLRRARVAIHNGDPGTGSAALGDLLAGQETMDEAQLDRFLQVVFDLQTVKADEAALKLLESLGERDWPGQRQRELLFWQADSQKAMEQYADAAYRYLRSATLLDPAAMDPWAQTARYYAAQSLAEAGMLDDARRLYRTLLRSTRDEGRQARLRNELQRLQLRASNAADRR